MAQLSNPADYSRDLSRVSLVAIEPGHVFRIILAANFLNSRYHFHGGNKETDITLIPLDSQWRQFELL